MKKGALALINMLALASILLLVNASTAADDVAFNALIQMGKNAETQGRLAVSGRRYRLEVQRDAQTEILIVDNKSDQTLRLDSRQKTYMTLFTRSKESLALNPIEVFRLTSGFYPRQPGGQETINGLKCRKISYLSNGKAIMTAWFAKDVSIPVKVVHHRFKEMNFELRDIQKDRVDPNLLSVPSDYKQTSNKSDKVEAPTEWVIKPNTPQTIALTEGKAFHLVVTDDAADKMATRGQMIFHRKAHPPVDRVEAPLKLPNGISFDLAYPASALIKSIEFHISQGGIQVKQVPPK